MMIRKNVNKLLFYENGHLWCISWWSILLSIMIVKLKCHLLNYCSLNKFLLNVYAYLCCKLDIHVTDLYSCIKISILQFLYKSLTRYSVSTQQNVSLTTNTLQILLSRQRDVGGIAGHSLLIIGLTHVEAW